VTLNGTFLISSWTSENLRPINRFADKIVFARIRDWLATSWHTDDGFTVFFERDHRWSRTTTFCIWDHFCLSTFHEGDTWVRGSEIDTDNFSHSFKRLKFSKWIEDIVSVQHVSDILGETQGHLQRITQSEIIFPDFLTLDAYPINQHAFQAMKELNQYHHSHVVSYRWKDHKIYAYMVLSGEKTSRKIQSVFSVSWNVWWDLIKKFLVDAPEKYAVSVDCPNYNILLNYMAQREWY
jgi:hypothetical protein